MGNILKDNNLKQHIEALLKNTKFSDEKGILFVNKILEAIETIDTDLVEILIKDDKAKKHFFSKVLDTFVMNQFKLIDFFSMNNYFEESYTSYTNKIGLIRKDDFIKKNNDVVLAFPYKDCVLEGGQTKDEQKGKENFFNEILDSDEIDRLFEPKVLTNIKRYTKDGVYSPSDTKGWHSQNNGVVSDTDNLILKGNNLLALHSLKKKYAGKVKLIYIDPPYNTGNDSFKYNDNFNHSTWLTFMKNRLEVAKALLKDDGAIFVQCDDNEQAYLKVLMDEVFKGNFVNCIIPEMSNLSGNKIEHAIQGRKFPKIKEYILLYAKNKNHLTLNIPKQTKDEWDSEYNIIFSNLTEKIFEKIENLIAENNQDALNEILKDQKIESLNVYLKENNIENTEEWKKQNSFRILASKPNAALIKKSLEINFEMQITSIRNSRGDLKVIRTDFNKKTETARIELVFAKHNLEIFLGDIWHKITTTGGVAQEGGVVLKNGKKPEQLLNIILKSATQPNDLVLDFHLGSGTTCAVAHKMGRQYIGIEQMDYIQDITVERMKKVIDGEQGGISKSVNWQGGGDFVYAELKQVANFDKADKKLKQEMRYLPIGELEDEDYKISKEEIEINKAFYGVNDE